MELQVQCGMPVVSRAEQLAVGDLQISRAGTGVWEMRYRPAVVTFHEIGNLSVADVLEQIDQWRKPADRQQPCALRRIRLIDYDYVVFFQEAFSQRRIEPLVYS